MKPASKKSLIRSLAQKQAKQAARVSDAIADLAEPGFAEFKSAKVLMDYLSQNGFRCRTPWPHNPTGFKASWGRRGPVIGLLAEYDALPNCGQEPSSFGHGCGHNVLGAAAAVGAVIATQALQGAGLPGRVVVWGCPAEELLAGKAYMARDGAFRGQDAILGFHPGSYGVCRKGGSALDSILFEFFGKTAHGASAHNGRSALDGVMLLDVATNYLREHVPENVRIHMCIRNGGDAPNVVPAYAKSWYFVRGKDRKQVDDVRQRLLACARAAALATGTKVKFTRLTAIYSRLENDVLGDALLENLQLFGVLKPTAQDIMDVKRLGKKPNFETKIAQVAGEQQRGSTDEDTVSWLAPFSRFGVPATSSGFIAHNREYASMMKLPYAHRSTMRAAEVFAATVLDLCSQRKLLNQAQREFKKRSKGFKFEPLIPKGQQLPSVNP